MAEIKRYPLKDISRTGLYLRFSSYVYGQLTDDKSGNRSYRENILRKWLNGANDNVNNGSLPSQSNSNNPPQQILDPNQQSFTNPAQSILDKLGTEARYYFQPNEQKTDDIYLYLPPKLEYQYSANWQKVQLGALGSAMTPGGMVGTTAAVAGNSAFNLLNTYLSNVPKLENLSLDSLIGATLGLSFNDNTVQSFDKMNPRNFSFEYIMVARNVEEQYQIEDIVRAFKLGMHPVETIRGAKGLFLGYPLVWKIEPANKDSRFSIRRSDGTLDSGLGSELLRFLPSTDYCGLTDVKVDYTPENNIALLKGGFVQAIRITLSFTELITLTRESLERLEPGRST